MPAAFFGAGLPTLSEVVSASFDHLLGAADYYDGAGELTENAFTRLRDPRAGPAAPSGMARRRVVLRRNGWKRPHSGRADSARRCRAFVK